MWQAEKRVSPDFVYYWNDAFFQAVLPDLITTSIVVREQL